LHFPRKATSFGTFLFPQLPVELVVSAPARAEAGLYYLTGNFQRRYYGAGFLQMAAFSD
jgi:hypothetical protein